jgi:hypothetical protein
MVSTGRLRRRRRVLERGRKDKRRVEQVRVSDRKASETKTKYTRISVESSASTDRFRIAPVDDTPIVQGVFCGYRATDEEYRRLKSAHADD